MVILVLEQFQVKLLVPMMRATFAVAAAGAPR